MEYIVRQNSDFYGKVLFHTKYYVILRSCLQRRENPAEANLVTKPTQDTFVLAWSKGANEQKSERYRLR